MQRRPKITWRRPLAVLFGLTVLLALDGSGWRDIITHYYTGVTVAAYTPEELS